jgi:hypothetical protein
MSYSDLLKILSKQISELKLKIDTEQKVLHMEFVRAFRVFRGQKNVGSSASH